MTGIYMIRNKENGKVYIGQSRDISRRWQDHRYLLSHNLHDNGHLQNAYNKYPGAFEFIVLLECPEEQLNIAEETLIEFFMGCDKNYGYNIERKPRGAGKHSEETLKKISVARMGHPVSDETRKLLSDALLGRPLSDETKQKMSESSARRKPIICIETGTIYRSIKSASDEVGLSDSAISACCAGDSETCGGRHWAYLSDYQSDPEYYADILRTYVPKWNAFGVICVETGIRYKSALEAERQTGIRNSSICECCKGKRKTAGGLHWKYNEHNDTEGTHPVAV